jgi:hypothetical protein
MFSVPLQRRRFFLEDPFFQASWAGYDPLRVALSAGGGGDLWDLFDRDLGSLACLAAADIPPTLLGGGAVPYSGLRGTTAVSPLEASPLFK